MKDPQTVIAKQLRYQLRKQARQAWQKGEKQAAKELLVKARLTVAVC